MPPQLTTNVLPFSPFYMEWQHLIWIAGAGAVLFAIAMVAMPRSTGRWGRLAARLGVATSVLATAVVFHVSFYRHFAHAKFFALWLILSVAVVGAIAGLRRGRIADPSCAKESRGFRLALLAVAATWSISLLFAINVGHGFEMLCRISPILIVAWWIAQKPLSWEKVTPWAVGVVLITSAAVFLLGLLQWDRFQEWSDLKQFLTQQCRLLSNDRWVGTLGNPNSAGSFYGAALTFLTSVALLDRSFARRMIGIVLAACMAFALVQTKSRSGMLGATAGLGVLMLVLVQCNRVNRHECLITATLGLILFVLGILLHTESQFFNFLLIMGQYLAIVGGLAWVLSTPPLGTTPADLRGWGFTVAALGGLLLVIVSAWLGGAPAFHDLALRLGVYLAVIGGLGWALTASREDHWHCRLPRVSLLVGAFVGAVLLISGIWLPRSVILIPAIGLYLAVFLLLAWGQRFARQRNLFQWLPLRGIVTSLLIVGFVVWASALTWLATADIDQVGRLNDHLTAVYRVINPESGKSFMDRLCIWKSAADIVADYPIFGVGFGQFPLVYPIYTQPEYYDLWPLDKLITTEEVHSGHLHIAVESGLIGGLAWLSLLGLAWFGAMRRLRWASEGDRSAGLVMIWLPLGVTLASHMAVDKYLAYPASLVLLMFCLGQMVRPRDVRGGDMVTPFRSSTTWGVGMAAMIGLAWLALMLAVGSISIGMGRSTWDYYGAYANAMNSARSQLDRRRIQTMLYSITDLADGYFAHARQFVPWEIDTWTRSIDYYSAINQGEDPTGELQYFLRDAVQVSPNYYPIQRNIGRTEITRGLASLRSANSQQASAELHLGIDILTGVVDLRENEVLSHISLIEAYSALNNEEGVREHCERFLRIPNIQTLRPVLTDQVRVRLIQTLVSMDDLESSLEQVNEAIDVSGLNPYPLWMIASQILVKMDQPAEAREALAARIDSMTVQDKALLIARVQSREGSVPDADQIWENVIAALVSNAPRTAVLLSVPQGTGREDPIHWAVAAVVASVASEDLVHEVLASAHQILGEAPLLTLCENQLLASGPATGDMN